MLGKDAPILVPLTVLAVATNLQILSCALMITWTGARAEWDFRDLDKLSAVLYRGI